MSKNYFWSSKYKIPYGSVPTFESKIEYPMASENLALVHLRSNTPSGFWNNGILGSIIGQVENYNYKLPTSPISPSTEKVMLKSEIGQEIDSVYMVISFFEGLDSVSEFLRIVEEVILKLDLEKLYLGIEYIPLLPEFRNTTPLGIDELILTLSKKLDVMIFNHHDLSRMIFSKRDHFIHIHNKIFYYYSVFEVKAKMNGASVIFLHPQMDLSLDKTDLDLYKTILGKQSLSLIELQLFVRHFLDLKFGVNNA